MIQLLTSYETAVFVADARGLICLKLKSLLNVNPTSKTTY